VRVQFTTERRSEFINTMLYKGLVLTAGSSSIQVFYAPMRTAAAATREMFVAAAARKWSVSSDECTVADSFVIHRPSGRRSPLGDLANAAMKESVPANPRLRSLQDQPLIGKRLSRVDVPSKCDGSARFGIDADVPGMLYAAVRHGPIWGSQVDALDADRARAMPGVRLVMPVPQGVAVVADQYWQAVRALAEVRETYSDNVWQAVKPRAGVRESYSGNVSDVRTTEKLKAALRAAMSSQQGDPSPENHGDVATAMKGAAKVIEAEFYFPLMAHACMEPVSCTASVVNERCELWLSTKSPSLDGGFAAEALGIDPGAVVVHNEYQGGDFGRRSGHDHVTEAVLLSKAVKQPVKVIWTRKEDFRCDQHRTSAITRARLGISADGTAVAYEIKTASDGVWRSLFPWFYAMKKPMDLPLTSRLVHTSYDIPNEAGSYVVVPHPVRIGAFRGNSDYLNGFVLETMLDEAAHASSRDPLQYRLSLLAKDPRSAAVLRRIAEFAGWGQTAPGRFQGLAFYQSEFYRCRIAAIAEVSKSADGIRVERAFAVCDSGLVINPLLAERCIEGGLIFGFSNVMHEQLTLSGGAPEQVNFNGYRLMRMNEAPSVEVEVISVGDQPGSFGEIGTMVAGPALGNAIFAATGQRIRSQPFAANGVSFA
jgi:isoquinoline 1-oxidoreductase subunit beta